MPELKLPEKLKNLLQRFTDVLKEIYQQDLVSVILYGSAASGEFVHKHSNLNVLVVLNNTDPVELKKSSGVVSKFKSIIPLFLTKDYIASSTDVFPIEFLDMQENYFILYGEDILKNIEISTFNLRFQCEQELKGKLLNLKHAYLSLNENKAGLLSVLTKSFTSVLHISRNVLRLKGNKPLYLKQDIINQLSEQLQIDKPLWDKLLAIKSKTIKIKSDGVEELFASFVKEVEKLIKIVDKL